MIKYDINNLNQPIVNGEVIELTKYPHFDGVNWYEFDNEEERQAFISANSQPIIWDKQTYCNEVNNQHNELFKTMYQQRNYIDIGEIQMWVEDVEYGQEAASLINWWILTCKIVDDYLNVVTEQTAQPINLFISSLPEL